MDQHTVLQKCFFSCVQNIVITISLLAAPTVIPMEMTENSMEHPYARSLHEAAAHGKLTLCQELISHGASILEQDNDGKTPIDRALEKDHLVIATYLLMQLGSPSSAMAEAFDLRDHNSRRKLTKKAIVENIKNLLENGIKSQANTSNLIESLHILLSFIGEGTSPLHAVIQSRKILDEHHVDINFIINLLYDNDPNSINVLDTHKKLAIYYAITHQYYDLVKVLTEKDVDFFLNPEIFTMIPGDIMTIERSLESMEIEENNEDNKDNQKRNTQVPLIHYMHKQVTRYVYNHQQLWLLIIKHKNLLSTVPALSMELVMLIASFVAGAHIYNIKK